MGVFKKIKSLTDSFGKAARRWTAVTTFAGSSLFLPGVALAQNAPANGNAPQTEQVTNANTELSDEKKQKINDEIVKQGQDQAGDLIATVEDSYSLWLNSLQADLNGQLAESNPDGDIRVVVLDPIQMDVGLAMGLSPEKTAELILKANGLDDPDAGLVFDVADAMTGYGYVSVAGDTTYTQVPMMIPLEPDENGVQVRLIIPMSSYTPILDIPGMPLSEEVKMVATHEGWHAMDQRLDERFADINFDNLKIDSLQTIEQKIANLDYLKLSCAVYNSESYADIGAAGDMIRAGAPIDVIDQIIAFRIDNNRDAGHMSPPSLLELKKRITEMGIDNFRALGDAEALVLYNDVLDDAGLTPARLTLVYQYIQCPPDQREAFVLKHKDNPDFDVAFSYINSFVTDATIDVLDVPGGGFSIEMFIDAMNAQDEIMGWDALADLQERAFAIDGKITPQSYAKAYGSLMAEMNTPLAEDASFYDQLVFEGKIIRLKNTFQDAVMGTDYVQANKDFGVDIVATDPALQAIADEPEALPAPAPSEQTVTPANSNVPAADDESDKKCEKKKKKNKEKKKDRNFYFPG